MENLLTIYLQNQCTKPRTYALLVVLVMLGREYHEYQ
jgi:hypothetical protein